LALGWGQAARVAVEPLAALRLEEPASPAELEESGEGE
jgi:hypothetical protein